MASINARLICLFILMYFIVTVDLRARRSGGRSSFSSRSFRSSRVRVTRVKSYTNVVLTGRIIRGSSPYTSNTWWSAYTLGAIYVGMRHRHAYHHTDNMPPICTNNFEKRPDGKTYGYFICPLDSDQYNEFYCCGPDKREYCCDKTEAQRYFAEHMSIAKKGISIGAIVGIVLSIIVVIVIIVCCCKKRKQAGQIIRKFSSRHGRARRHMNGPQAEPLNSLEKSWDGTGPPPQRHDDTKTSNGYDCYTGVTYRPPQPQTFDEKSGLPPPGVDPGAPYPLPGGPTDGAPYPITGGAPYPSANGAPYMPSAGITYPPPTGAPYPPPTGAPYPPPAGAPYPPPTGASYPPYPMQAGATYPMAPAPPYPGEAYPTAPHNSAVGDGETTIYPPAVEPPYPVQAGATYPTASAPPYPGEAYPTAPPNSAVGDGETTTYPPYPPASHSHT